MQDTIIITPNVARIYNAFLDRSKTLAANREAVIEVQKVMPNVLKVAKENRSFLHRCVRYILGHGIKQFIDVSSGFITEDNVHELVQEIDPAIKIVYVDRNLKVIEEGSKLLATNRIATIIYADIRKPEDVFNHPDLSGLIDFAEPVGILIICITCFFKDIELPHIMSAIESTICDGSYVALTYDTLDSHLAEKDNIAEV